MRLTELKRRIAEVEGELEAAQGEVDRLESELAELWDQEKKAEDACPRCYLKHQRNPETNSVCCARCGWCELERDGLEEHCPYHGAAAAS